MLNLTINHMLTIASSLFSLSSECWKQIFFHRLLLNNPKIAFISYIVDAYFVNLFTSFGYCWMCDACCVCFCSYLNDELQSPLFIWPTHLSFVHIFGAFYLVRMAKNRGFDYSHTCASSYQTKKRWYTTNNNFHFCFDSNVFTIFIYFFSNFFMSVFRVVF